GACASGETAKTQTRRIARLSARTVPDVGGEGTRGPGLAYDGPAERAVSVCRNSLVFHAVRARRHRHRPADALARSVPRTRRAAVPGREPGPRDFRVRRLGSRKD